VIAPSRLAAASAFLLLATAAVTIPPSLLLRADQVIE